MCRRHRGGHKMAKLLEDEDVRPVVKNYQLLTFPKWKEVKFKKNEIKERDERFFEFDLDKRYM